MPIKELVTLGMMVVGTLTFAYGPNRLQMEMRKLQFQILKEVARTDNWGNPDIFKHMNRHGGQHEKRTRSL